MDDNEYSPEQLDKDITRMQEKKSFRKLMKLAVEERKAADRMVSGTINSPNSFLKFKKITKIL